MFRIYYYCLIALFTLCGCGTKKMERDFEKNISNSNSFYSLDDMPFKADFSTLEDKESSPKTSSFNLKRVDLAVLSNVLSIVYDVTINNDKSDDSSLHVSLKMHNVTLSQVLEYLLEQYNIGSIKTSYGLILYPPELKTKFFSINYHDFERNSSSAISINSTKLDKNDSNSSTNNKNYSLIETSTEEQFWNNLQKSLINLLKRDKVLFEKYNNTSYVLGDHMSISQEGSTVMITAYPQTLNLVEQFMSKINSNALIQIIIEAKILEIELDDEFSSGIQWERLTQSNAFITSGASRGVENTRDVFRNVTLANAAGNEVSTIVSGIIKNNHFATVLQALSSQGKISVLSSPMITTLNKQRALIKYGEEKQFVSNINNVTTSNAQTGAVINSGFSFESFFSGIALDATPRIVENDNIILHIHPVISRVISETIVLQIDNKKTEIPTATVKTREADTLIKAKTGNIIVLGGITQDMVNLSSAGLSTKDNSPLSKLFSPLHGRQQSSRKKELVILIKPTICGSSMNEFTKKLQHINND